MVGNQIGSLTPDPSFDHNLCFKYPNSHASPLQISKFQNLFNDIRNFSIQWVLTFVVALWKFKNPPKLQFPKWEFNLGMKGFIPSHFPTLLKTWNLTLELHSWLAPLQTLTLVASPKLKLQFIKYKWTFHHNKFKQLGGWNDWFIFT
jgi:hypothetical protein